MILTELRREQRVRYRVRPVARPAVDRVLLPVALLLRRPAAIVPSLVEQQVGGVGDQLARPDRSDPVVVEAVPAAVDRVLASRCQTEERAPLANEASEPARLAAPDVRTVPM